MSILGVIALGFFREFLFIHINEHLFALWYDEPSRATDAIPLLARFDYSTLYASKWVLTILFAGFFYIAIVGILYAIFRSLYWKELGVVYLVLFVGAALSLGLGYVINSLEDAYIIARFFMGIAQSPLLLMVMVLGIFLRKRRQAIN